MFSDEVLHSVDTDAAFRGRCAARVLVRRLRSRRERVVRGSPAEGTLLSHHFASPAGLGGRRFRLPRDLHRVPVSRRLPFLFPAIPRSGSHLPLRPVGLVAGCGDCADDGGVAGGRGDRRAVSGRLSSADGQASDDDDQDEVGHSGGLYVRLSLQRSHFLRPETGADSVRRKSNTGGGYCYVVVLVLSLPARLQNDPVFHLSNSSAALHRHLLQRTSCFGGTGLILLLLLQEPLEQHQQQDQGGRVVFHAAEARRRSEHDDHLSRDRLRRLRVSRRPLSGPDDRQIVRSVAADQLGPDVGHWDRHELPTDGQFVGQRRHIRRQWEEVSLRSAAQTLQETV